MTSKEQIKNHLRGDIMIIFVLMVLVLGFMAVLVYLESTQPFVEAWSAEFYRVLLRR
jgi:hypothetical protein